MRIFHKGLALGVLVILGLLCTGVGDGSARKPISPFEVYGSCLSSREGSDDRGGCGLKQDYCTDLRNVVSREYASEEECVRECFRADDRFRIYPDYYSCGSVFNTGRRWCTKYCRTNYE